MTELTNDQNIKNLKKRKILRSIIIFFCILTIILAILAMIYKYLLILPVISFIISTILINKREQIPIKLSEDLEIKKIQKEIDKQKKKRKSD